MRHTNIEDSNLSGNAKNNQTWEKGFNGVYKNSDKEGFRVSLRIESGWRTFGYFNDLNTAAYIANVAILATNSEGNYQINSEVKPNKDELANWLQANEENKIMHNIAKNKFLKDAELEFPTLSNLNTTEQYVENIKKGRYSIDKLRELKKLARPGGSISSAIDAAISKYTNYK